MNPLDDYFSLLDIARVLCRMRVRVASTRRKRCLYDKYFPKGSREQPKADKETVKKIERKEAAEAFLASLLPPRRAWKRDNRASRKGLDSATIAEQSIFRVVRAHSRRGTLGEQTWGARLLAFCEGIRGRLSDPEFAFSAPSLVLLRKSVGRISAMDETARKSAYRCLSTFPNLDERVILSRLSAYLRDALELELGAHCYAFRSNGETYSFATAVRDLAAYRKGFPGGVALYAADCDIQKFFDVIGHGVVRESYRAFAARLEERGVSLDARAGRVLEAYLACYAFPGNLDACTDGWVARNREFVDRVGGEVVRGLYADCGESLPRMGVPQGGALSPVIANLVLAEADRMVLDGADERLFYARFCDDMILVHPDQGKCAEALARYCRALERLRLPKHPLREAVLCNADYFGLKSKGPVAWKPTAPDEPGTNWISFLGHQVRYDGEVRIRKETIRKHQEKLWREFDRLLASAKLAKGRFADGLHWSALFERFRLRVIAIGVGRVNAPPGAPQVRSWLSVFMRQLSGRAVQGQMRLLDQTRERVLAGAKRMLKNLWRSRSRDGDSSPLPRCSRRYYGAPFSYYGSLRELLRPRLRARRRWPTLRDTDYSEL
ncbi:MAG: reverse transcriptase domain-containing protein [Kiritimatiellia bacterium]|nr:reverse transcriptase domain-containing protein [Kiritimatiellia bacterium]